MCRSTQDRSRLDGPPESRTDLRCIVIGALRRLDRCCLTVVNVVDEYQRTLVQVIPSALARRMSWADRRDGLVGLWSASLPTLDAAHERRTHRRS